MGAGPDLDILRHWGYLGPMKFLLLLLLPGCAVSQLAGTWMFTRTPSPVTGSECVTGDVSHNFDGAYVPEVEEDTGNPWTEEQAAEESPQVFFGRIEEVEGGMVLVVGDRVYTSASEGKDSWEFSWSASESSTLEQNHSSDYLYSTSSEQTSTIRYSGTFSKGTFDGLYETESSATQRWTESDTWSDEVVATLGTTGQIPASAVLVRVDGTGAEVPAYNDYATFDCEDSDCSLSANSACLYTDVLTGVWTEFLPEDNRWVQGTGQPAGIP